MKVNITFCLFLLLINTKPLFGQKTFVFDYKNKAGLGYSVLFPPIQWEYDGGVNIIEREPFHGMNMGFERKIINHFSINFMAHITRGEQNGRTVRYSYPVRISHWSQIDLGGRFYFLKKMQGVFMGGGYSYRRGNLFQINDGKSLDKRYDDQWGMSLGYSHRFKDRFYISLQGLTLYWVNPYSHPTFKERIRWGSHTISLQTGIAF